MKSIMFIGCEEDSTEDRVCVVGDTPFPRGKSVAVPDDVFAQLSDNPAFRVVKTTSRAAAETEKE